MTWPARPLVSVTSVRTNESDCWPACTQPVMVTESAGGTASSAASPPAMAKVGARVRPVRTVFIAKPPSVGVTAKKGPSSSPGNCSLESPLEPGDVLVHLLLPVRPVVSAVRSPVVEAVADPLRLQELRETIRGPAVFVG